MPKSKKMRDFFIVGKRGTEKTMIPCPYCKAFFSVDEYFSYKTHWRSDIIEASMQVVERNFETRCPICRAKFILTEHMKPFNDKYKGVYFSVSRKHK